MQRQYFSKFPRDIDLSLFDKLKYDDLITAISENPKYNDREKRQKSGLEKYIEKRILKDFLLSDYREMTNEFKNDPIIKLLDFYDENDLTIKFFKSAISNNIDPFILYQLLTDEVGDYDEFKNFLNDPLNNRYLDFIYNLDHIFNEYIETFPLDQALPFYYSYIDTIDPNFEGIISIYNFANINPDNEKILINEIIKYALDKNNLIFLKASFTQIPEELNKIFLSSLANHASNEQLEEIFGEFKRWYNNR